MQWLLIIGYASSALAGKHYYQNDINYDDGHLGTFPSNSFKTTSYISPRQNILSLPNNQPCKGDGLHTLLALRGTEVPYPGPVILDSEGSLVWTETRFEQPYNLQIQEYKGEPHLTFWAGRWDLPGHATGFNYILNSSYHVVKTVRGADNLDPDLHEFTILPSSNTALIVIAPARQADLRPANNGPKEGWIWDGGFQEVDLDTGEAVFDWRAYDHIPIDKSFFERSGGLTVDDAYDYFHINSVEKDADGNYLISSRYLHAIFCISGVTGNHHARWHHNYTSITLFDNGANESMTSHGIWFDIDPVTRTVRTRHAYMPRNSVYSGSQGSLSLLPNGNVLAGFGSAAQYMEFTPDGTPICEIHFAPHQNFIKGWVESYRVLKAKWVGRPQTNPDVVLEDDLVDGSKWMYMSWMGATEVRKWRIEAKGRRREDDEDKEVKGEVEEAITLATVPKDGFETAIDLSRHTVVAATSEEGEEVPTMRKRSTHLHQHQHQHQLRNRRPQSVQFFRAVALDDYDAVLGTSAWVDAGEQLIAFFTTSVSSSSSYSSSSFPSSSSSSSSTSILAGPKKYSLVIFLTAVTIILLGCTPCLWLLVTWLRKKHSLRKATTGTDAKAVVVTAYQRAPDMEKE